MLVPGLEANKRLVSTFQRHMQILNVPPFTSNKTSLSVVRSSDFFKSHFTCASSTCLKPVVIAVTLTMDFSTCAHDQKRTNPQIYGKLSFYSPQTFLSGARDYRRSGKRRLNGLNLITCDCTLNMSLNIFYNDR